MKRLLALLFLSVNFSSPKAQESDIIRGPYLQVATSNSITIRWRTAIATPSIVYCLEKGTGYTKKFADSIQQSEHNVQLTGLQPDTKYVYSISADSSKLQNSPDGYFYTLPITGQPSLYRIGVFGDCGNNSVNQRNVRNQLLQYLDTNYLTSWLLLGDNAYGSGKENEYQSNFFGIYKNDLLKTSPVWPSPGNHDYANAKSLQLSHDIPYYKVFNFPVNGEAGGYPSHNPSYYSFDIGNIHFLSLDSYGMETNNAYRLYDTTSQQVQWVKQDLEANHNKGWVIAYWHHPPYTMGTHNSDSEAELAKLRQNFIGILERYGVDMVLCGHSHVYERSSFIKGYTGTANQFDPATHALSSSNAAYDGSSNSCPYIKDTASPFGTVYVVTGSSGQLGGSNKGFPMSVMQYSNATDGGCLLLEVQANRLDAKWICGDGAIRDKFTIMKNVNRHNVYSISDGSSLSLTASYIGNYIWNNSRQQTISINKSFSEPGFYQYKVQDEFQCISDTFDIQVIKSNWDKEVVIAPNPAKSNEVKIKLVNNLSVAATIALYDGFGRMIKQKNMQLTSDWQSVGLPKVPEGFYLLLVRIKGTIALQKKLLLQ